MAMGDPSFASLSHTSRTFFCTFPRDSRTSDVESGYGEATPRSLLLLRSRSRHFRLGQGNEGNARLNAGMLMFINFTADIVLRRGGEPLCVYIDLEACRRRSGHEDIFITHHGKDDVQATYDGALFHNNRNYHVSHEKNNVSSLLYPKKLYKESMFSWL